MPSVVRFDSPRSASIVDLPDTAVEPGEVRIRTRYSGISAGTELTAYRGTNPYLGLEWDADRRLFIDGTATMSYPIDGMGYEEVGEIVELGGGVEPGLLGRPVWGGWGHRSNVVRDAAWAAERLLPTGVDPVLGIFAKIGAIALNAVVDAEIHVGETVVVFGLGVPGQIVAQLATLNGSRVIGVDVLAGRRSIAAELGLAEVLSPDAGVAERVKELTGGHGADVCIEMSGSHAALGEAIRAVAYGSKVVAGGFYQGDASELRLGTEFHHNRVTIVSSQISGVNPAVDHRWNELRMSRTILEYASTGRLQLEALITHRLPVADASSAFQMLDRSPHDALQVVLEFGGD